MFRTKDAIRKYGAGRVKQDWKGEIYDTQGKYDEVYFGALNSVHGYAGTAFEVAPNGSTFVGLDYKKVEIIRTAIREYVKKIQDELSKLNTEASNSNALKGEIADAATRFVVAVSDVAKAYVSSLLSYSDKMYNYAMQMARKDSSIMENVDTTSNTLKSKTETYTEQHNEEFKAGGVGAGVVSGAVGAAAGIASGNK